jgi:methionine synthase II (cobalamin-independent)
VVPPGRRFQVCLPTAMSSACMYVSPRAHDDYLRVYERSLLQALRDITAAIPHRELSIQWDICQEVLVFENYFPSRPVDYKERIFALLERLSAAVPADVELGYHLCYGSPADQHLVMPTDAGVLAELARAIAAAVRRPLDFIHLPVPRERDDAAYFAPLRGLRLPERTRLYLGLIHHDDAAGDRRRIDTARGAVGGGFGVATECGWGRGEPARLDGLLESHRRAVDYLLAGGPR